MGELSRNVEKCAKNVLWGVLGFLFARKQSAKLPLDLENIKSVLVVRPDRLGDVVLSTPVYESIKLSVPGARLTVLVDKSNTGLLADNPDIDDVLAWNPKQPFKTLRALRQKRFDLTFTLNKTFSATASLLTLVSGAKYRVGYKQAQNAWVHDVQVDIDKEPRHEIENNLELLKAVGLRKIVQNPKLTFNAKEADKITALLAEKNRHPDRPLVLIKPGTRVPEWGWRLEKFQAVTDHLLKNKTAEVFLISGPGEEAMTERFIRDMETPPVRLPPLSIKELALLIQKSDLLFCNHTGIMHLASAVQTPVLAIFKHGEIARWGPYNTNSIILEERGSDSLSPETSIESIDRLLNRDAS
jgi:ADP-heptose:LPS heptosyltransferase